jgi:hypothetical protein
MAKKQSPRPKLRTANTPVNSQVWLRGGGGNPGVAVAYISIDPSDGGPEVFYSKRITAAKGDVILWTVVNNDQVRRTVRIGGFQKGNAQSTPVDFHPKSRDQTDVDAYSVGSITARVQIDANAVIYKYTIEVSDLGAIDPDLDITPPE